MHIKNKFIAAIAAVAFVLPGVSLAQTQSVASLQAEIQALEAQLAQLETSSQSQIAQTGGGGSTASPWCFSFNANLGVGASGAAVTALQTALQKDGESVTVNGTFGSQTAAAVTAFQEKYASSILAPFGLKIGTGYAGSGTRARLNAIFGCGASSTSGSQETSSATTGASTFAITVGGNATVNVNSAQQLLATFYITSPVVTTLSTISIKTDNTVTAAFVPLANLRVYVTSPAGATQAINPTNWFGATQAVVSPSSAYTFSGSFAMPAGALEEIQVYGDVGAATPASYAPITLASAAGVDATVTSVGSVHGQGNLNVESTTGGSTFTASAQTINSGGSVTLAWNSVVVDGYPASLGISCGDGTTVTVTDAADGTSDLCDTMRNNIVTTGSDVFTINNTRTTPATVAFTLSYGMYGSPWPQYVTVNPEPSTVLPCAETAGGCAAPPVVTGTLSVSPSITSASPSSAAIGSTVTISGSGFTSTGNTVELNGYGGASNLSSSNGTSLTFTVPSTLSPICTPGEACPDFILQTEPATYQILVVNADGTSNAGSLTVTGSATTLGTINPIPTITFSMPTAPITLGQSFTITWSTTNATACTAIGPTGSAWNGSKATSGSQSVTPTVAGLGTAYNIQCTGPGGTQNIGNTITVNPATTVVTTPPSTPSPLAITSLSAYSGPIGATVTITGSGFASTNNTIEFGGKEIAVLNSSNGTSLSFTIPSTWVPGVALPTGSYSVAVVVNGETSNSESFTVTAPASTPVVTAVPTVSLTASPTAFTLGSFAELNWSSTNTSACTATGSSGDGTAWSGAKATSGVNLQVTPTASGAQTYTLTCTGANGTASASASVTVNPTTAVSFSPSTLNFSIPQGQLNNPSAPVTLTVSPNQTINWIWSLASVPSWMVINGSSATASTGSSLNIGINSLAANLAPGTYTGTLTVSPASGSSPNFTPVTITVNLTVTAVALVQTPAPTITLSASPTAFTLGYSTELNWSTTNATTCTATGSSGDGTAWSGSKATSGTNLQVTPTASGVQTYTLTCTGPGGTSAPVSTSVTVLNANVSASPSTLNFTIPQGQMSNPSSAVTLSVTPSQTITWNAALSQGWILFNAPINTSDNVSIGIGPSAGSLAPGTHTGTVTLSPSSGSPYFNSQTITVNLTVTAS